MMTEAVDKTCGNCVLRDKTGFCPHFALISDTDGYREPWTKGCDRWGKDPCTGCPSKGKK